MSSRVVTRAHLRTLSETALIRILGNVPRKLRRSAGRIYANEAYRYLNGTSLMQSSVKSNQTVIEWVSREYSRYVTGLDAKTRSGNDAGSPASGPGERTPEVSIIPIAED